MANKRVLLVDDDQVYVKAISAVLETEYEVITAANGAEALEAVAEQNPDVVVLDVMMDHLSEGFDVARKLKRDPETQGIPVILLTAVDQVYDYRMEAGASYVPYDRFLEKPVAPRALLQDIKEVLAAAGP